MGERTKIMRGRVKMLNGIYLEGLDPTYDKSAFLVLSPFRVSKGPKRAKYRILAKKKKLVFFSSESQTKEDGRSNHR